MSVRDIRNCKYSQWSSKWPVNLLSDFTSPTVGEVVIDAHLEIFSSIGTVLLCSQFICRRRFLYIVCIEGVQWRFSFVISFHWGFFQLTNGFVTSRCGPFKESCVQRILCLVKATSFQYFKQIGVQNERSDKESQKCDVLVSRLTRQYNTS